MIGENSICSHLRFGDFSIFSVSAKTEGSDDYWSLWLSGRASASGSGGRGFESRPCHTKGVKMVPVATFLGAQHYKASTGFHSPNKHRTTIIATLKKVQQKLSPIIINVCIYRRTVWKTGNYAKYVILLKYRNYYYYADAKYLNVTIFLGHRKFENCCTFRLLLNKFT